MSKKCDHKHSFVKSCFLNVQCYFVPYLPIKTFLNNHHTPVAMFNFATHNFMVTSIAKRCHARIWQYMSLSKMFINSVDTLVYDQKSKLPLSHHHHNNKKGCLNFMSHSRLIHKIRQQIERAVQQYKCSSLGKSIQNTSFLPTLYTTKAQRQYGVFIALNCIVISLCFRKQCR